VRRFELERAIAENQLLLQYQPIVDVPGRGLSAVEALVRWKHPERGIVSPTEFIPEAEATGLIRRLTFWVLREALLQGNVWRRDGIAVSIAVNLSLDNLHDAHFRRFLELTLKVAGGPETLIAESSARSLARDPSPPIATLELMRDRRIRVALDDATDEDAHIVESMPADIIKVGRGLVTRMGRDHRAREYVRAVVSAARERKLTAIAVGVEDRTTWDLLPEIGFAGAQGYFIAPPLSASEFAQWRGAKA
jgi:EAL domain-containing protein (putative c-di-GMP-specific phosphodiesterase class I)